MVAKLFNVGGEQYLGVQPDARTTEIRKINNDGSTTVVASKHHWGKGYTPTELDSFSKVVYDSDGISTQVVSFDKASNLTAKRAFCFSSETGETLLKGVLDRTGKRLVQLDFIDPKILTNPEMLKGNAKYVLNKIIEHLSKVR